MKIQENNIHTDKVNEQTMNSRRSFLKKIWGALGIIAGLELSLISMSFLIPGKKKKQKYNVSKIKTVGRISDFKLNSVFPFRDGKFYLVRMNDGGFMALSLKCSHLGCAVVWNENRQEFVCPCHSSTFDIKGDVTRSPASRALDMYPVFIEEGMVKVDTSKSTRRIEFDKQQLVYA